MLKGINPVVIENSPGRREFVKDCLPKGVNAFPTLAEARMSCFNDKKAPIDLAIDTTPGLLGEIYPQLSCGATYMSIGLKQKIAEINTIQLADKSLSIMGSIDSLHGTFNEAYNLIRNGLIPAEKIISHIMPLSEYKEAFAVIGCSIGEKSMFRSSEKSGKILLEI
ncbi:MAG: zinc-binding dehydrogenase, partial [Oligoflexales bacterium]|nr:zinc-binding dehydrogenase [Oligoflexales bacterium]